jgi:hypothetical protein
MILLDDLCEHPSVKADDAVLLTIHVVPPPLLCGGAPDIHIAEESCHTVLKDFEEVFRDADIAFRLYCCAPPKKRKRDVDIPLTACTKTIFSNRDVLENLCSYFEGGKYLSLMSEP